MPIASVPLPLHSHLHVFCADGDFLDCYAQNSPNSARRAAEIITTFPWWAKSLVWLRKMITAPFGLKQSGGDSGDMLGPFPVVRRSENEVIAGFDDTHLDFRISVLKHADKIHLATWVRPHNWFGRCYLSLIKPFHILIARNGVYRAALAG